jgi:hypothetical protein
MNRLGVECLAGIGRLLRVGLNGIRGLVANLAGLICVRRVRGRVCCQRMPQLAVARKVPVVMTSVFVGGVLRMGASRPLSGTLQHAMRLSHGSGFRHRIGIQRCRKTPERALLIRVQRAPDSEILCEQELSGLDPGRR